MKDTTFGIMLIIVALVCLATMITKDVVNNRWEKEAIKQGNGYYDPETAVFKWNSNG